MASRASEDRIRKALPKYTRAPPIAAPSAAKPAATGGRSRPDYRSWISGLAALASLAACVAMPLVVYGAGAESYTDNMAWFRNWLIVPTIVYFVSGTVWQWRRMRRNA